MWLSAGISVCEWWGTPALVVLLLIVVDYIGAEPASRGKPVMMHPLLLQRMNQEYLFP